MNSKLKLRREFAWPIAGMAIAVLIGVTPTRRGIPLEAGIATWFVAMALALTLSASSIGARVAVLMTGLFLAVPCFVQASPLWRFILMCTMALPFAAATALVLVPPIPGVRARLAYLCTWGGTRVVTRREKRFDAPALLQLIVATAVLAAAIAAIKAAPAHGPWLLARWFAGGVGALAFAEMATASLPLIAAAFGIAVPPLFQSPYLSASIGEFWTKRWNLGASEKIFRPYCFEPLAKYGAGFALFVTFLASAVAHFALAFLALGQWTISLACGAFFLVQPLLIGIERWLRVRRWHRAAGRAWTLIVLTLVSPLFIEPMLRMIEKSWDASDNALVPTVWALGFLVLFSTVIAFGSLPSRPSDVAAKGV